MLLYFYQCSMCTVLLSIGIGTIDNVPAHNVTVKNIFCKRWNFLKNVLIYLINVLTLKD